MTRKDHWENVYTTKPVEKLGWYKAHLQTSIEWIGELGLARNAPIIDVGGGASTLVDDLLDIGYGDITVLDISGSALESSRTRLGEKANRVVWLEGDITRVTLPHRHFQLWHDRAVFHFLTTPGQQNAYRETLCNALKHGGDVILAVFSPEAPPTCSGLPVQRYTAERLQEFLGVEFVLKRSQKELHETPGGIEQMYLYCHFRATDLPGQ